MFSWTRLSRRPMVRRSNTQQSRRARLWVRPLEERAMPSVVTNALDSGAGSLRQAIIDANAAAGAETITFDTAGVFATFQTIALTSGEMAITDDVTITGPGSRKLTINNTKAASTTSRIFNIANAVAALTVNISGMTLSGGSASSAGGAVVITDESVTFNDCVFTRNVATVTGGGAIAVTSTGNLTVQNSTVNSNTATGINGGGILASVAGATINLKNSTISSNVSLNGAGMYTVGATVLGENCTFTANVTSGTTGQGGAVYLSSTTATSETFQNCTFYANQASDGGAFRGQNSSANLTLFGCTVVNNTATPANAGGINWFPGTGTITIESTVISGNIAAGAAGHPDVENNNAPFNYKNSLIGNQAGLTAGNDQGGNLAAGTNPMFGLFTGNGGTSLTLLPLVGSPLIDAGTNPASLPTDERGQPRLAGANPDIGATELDPDVPQAAGTFANVVLAGPTTQTLQITYTDDVAVMVATLNTGDILVTGPNGFGLTATFTGVDVNSDGTPRVATYQFAPPGGSWDPNDNGTYTVAMQAGQVTDTGGKAVATGLIGTFRASMLGVTNANDSGVGSLRQSIIDANATPGADTIAFDAAFFATPRTINLTSGEMVINDSVTIVGPGASFVSLNSQKLSSTTSHIFNIAGAGILTVNISGLALTNANSTTTGGAVLITDESVTFNNCVFAGNQSSVTGGGAIAVSSTANLTILNSTIMNNSATGTTADGGAIRMAAGSTLNMQNSTVSGNSAGDEGGGLYFLGTSLSIINSTFSGNLSRSNGGAMRFRTITTPLNIQNSTIVGNTARFNGGAMDLFNFTGAGAINFESTVLAQNVAPLSGPNIANNSALLVNMLNCLIDNDANANVTNNGGTLSNVPAQIRGLAGNGGPTLTMAPQIASPLLDVGSNPGGGPNDQRGLARLVGAAVDMGAVEFDPAIPLASGAFANVKTVGGTIYTFQVTFTDDTGINVGTLGADDVRVIGPGLNTLASFVSVDVAGNGTPRTATYKFTAPGGTWDVADNGLFTVNLESGKVTDTSSNAVPAGLLGYFTVAAPTVYTVTNINDAGAGSLRQAVLDANANPGPDAIAFDATFNIAQTITITTGEMVINDPLTITGPGSGLLTINSTKAVSTTSHIFNISGTGYITVNVSGMVISGGTTSTAGGGVTINDEFVSFTDCVLKNNTTTTTGGGAITINAFPGRLTLQSCTLTNNSTTGTTADGGAIRSISGFVTIQDSIISGNTTGDDGGAIYGSTAGFTIINSSIVNNSAPNAASGTGGAISFAGAILFGTPFGGQFIVRNSTVSGNTAGLQGGAFEFNAAFNSTLVIQNSTVTNNTAVGTGANQGGGGVHFADLTTPYDAKLSLESTIISGNNNSLAPDVFTKGSVDYTTSALGSGTGIVTLNDNGGNLALGINLFLAALAFNGGPAAMLTHLPGGISPVRDVGSNSSGLTVDQRGFVRLLNAGVDIGSIESPGGIPAASGTFGDITTPGGTLYQLNVQYDDETAIKISTFDSFDIRITGPNGFNQLAKYTSATPGTNNKTETAKYEFVPPGGTWDGVDDGVYTVSVEPGQVTDNAGNPVPAGAIGTFKVSIPRSFVIVNTNDSGAGSLRQALLDANTAVGTTDTVTFDAVVFAGASIITLTTGEIPISDNIIITGPTAALTISGNNTSRIFNINGAGVVNASISKLSFTNGNAAGAGGAIAITDESVTLDNCMFTNNTSTLTGGAAIGMTGAGTILLKNSTLNNNNATGVNGGALLASTVGSKVTISYCTIAGNTAGNGAGIYINGATLLVENSAFYNNSAALTGTGIGQGGAVYLTNAGTATSMVFNNSTLFGNSAADGGGFRPQNNNSNLVINNCTIVGNFSTVNAGAININGGTGQVFLESTIIFNNTANGAAGHPEVENNLIANAFTYGTSLIGDPTGLTSPTDLGTNLAPGTDPLLQPLGNFGGPTQSMPPMAGSPVLDVGSNSLNFLVDQRGLSRQSGAGVDIGSVELQPAAPPSKLTTVVINNGDVQRSRVTLLKVNFDSPVSFTGGPANAFTLKRQSDGAAVTLNGVLDISGTFVTITFTGGAVDGAVGNYSIQDGRYTLTVLASQFAGSGFDGNGNGTAQGSPADDYVFASTAFPTAPTNIFRIFGDFNGDGAVAAGDFIQFRLALGGNSPIFDFDADGAVATSDFIQFRLRFGGSI